MEKYLNKYRICPQRGKKISVWQLVLWIALAGTGLFAQDFSTTITFTPSGQPEQAKTRSFSGTAIALDGYDAYDEMGPPPSLFYYVYFSIKDFPRYLWTDVRSWIAPYETEKKWTIIITNANEITTHLSWDPKTLAPLAKGRFLLNITGKEPINMKKADSASVTGNATMTILYDPIPPRCTLQLSLQPAAGGSITPSPGSYSYLQDTTIQVLAAAAAGYRFNGWSEGVANRNDSTTTVLMDIDKSITAYFVQKEYSITGLTEGRGRINKNPEQLTYHLHDRIVVYAQADSGYQFTHWSGDWSGIKNPDTLRVTGAMHITAHFTLLGSPDIDVEPRYHNFGRVEIGDSLSILLTIINTGAAPLRIIEMALQGADSAQFQIQKTVLPLLMPATCIKTLRLVFSPTQEKLFTASLRIISNDYDESPFIVELSGEGILSPAPLLLWTPSEMNFGETSLESIKTEKLTLLNGGNASLNVTRMQMTGRDEPEFWTTNAGVFVIEPNRAHTIELNFQPKSLGTKSASLQIQSNDEAHPGIDISLTGTGVSLLADTTETFAYPNPFDPTRQITQMLFMKSCSEPFIEIFDAAGALVVKIKVLSRGSGLYQYIVPWDGRNSRGDYVVNGVYFYVVHCRPDQSLWGRIAVLKN